MELIDLTRRAMEIRESFNRREVRRNGRAWSPEEVMQGFVVDVGDLMRAVMAKAGRRELADVDARLAHELGDCLWGVLVLARLHDLDLEKEFLRNMDELERKTDGSSLP